MKQVFIVLSACLSVSGFAKEICGTTRNHIAEIRSKFSQRDPGSCFKIDSAGIPLRIYDFYASHSNLAQKQVDKTVEELNLDFSAVGVSFYVEKIESIQTSKEDWSLDDEAFRGNSETAVGEKVREQGILKIFFVDHLFDGAVSDQQKVCGAMITPSAGYAPYIVMNKDCGENSIDGSTEVFSTDLAHEMGHLFGLLHTFENFDGVMEEYVDRMSPGIKSCQKNGDFLCDTPADPGFENSLSFSIGFDANGSLVCDYEFDSTLVDRDEIPYQSDPDIATRMAPDSYNHMSYAKRACRRSFSTGQIEVMKGIQSRLFCAPGEKKDLDFLRIFPNPAPANHLVVIEVPYYVAQPEEYEAVIHDMSGRRIRKLKFQHIHADANTHFISFYWDGKGDAGTFVSPGVYGVSVVRNGRRTSYSQKLILQ